MDPNAFDHWALPSDSQTWESSTLLDASGVRPGNHFDGMIDDESWMELLGAHQFPSELGTPSSPSEAQDDITYSPATPLNDTPIPGGFSLIPMNVNLDFRPSSLPFHASPPQPQPQPQLQPQLQPQPDYHDPLRDYRLIPGEKPSPAPVDPSGDYPLADLDVGPVEPPSPFPLRTLDAKKARRRKLGEPKFYPCGFDGCYVSFTSSRRDIERHRASVHGPPIKLPCGDLLSYRPDNVSRHRKKCECCMAAYIQKCDEEGVEPKPRPGRKRKSE